MQHHRPRKRFGQHFLTDEYILRQIVASVAPRDIDDMVEIGPGPGALTELLLPEVNSLSVIEIDRDLAASMRERFKHEKNFQLFNDDVLNFNIASLDMMNLRIVGNLPYNISTPLMFTLFESLDLIKDMHFMLQKEVVDRLTAKVGGSHYGRLTVMAQYYCENRFLFHVKPTAFTPPPAVQSAVLRMTPIKRELTANDMKKFAIIVREAFNHRRKTLHNCLKHVVNLEQLETLNIDLKKRPQELSVEDFILISNACDLTPSLRGTK